MSDLFSPFKDYECVIVGVSPIRSVYLIIDLHPVHAVVAWKVCVALKITFNAGDVQPARKRKQLSIYRPSSNHKHFINPSLLCRRKGTSKGCEETTYNIIGPHPDKPLVVPPAFQDRDNDVRTSWQWLAQTPNNRLEGLPPHNHRMINGRVPEMFQVSWEAPGNIPVSPNYTTAIHRNDDGNLGSAHMSSYTAISALIPGWLS